MSHQKEKKPAAPIIVAILSFAGTVIAALLGSPFLAKFLDQSGTQTPPAVVTTVGTNQVSVFSQDFEGGTSGFVFDQGSWTAGKDKSNKVLSVDASSSPAVATFGPSDFTNGVIEFKVMFNQFGGDGVSIDFRHTNDASYALSLTQNQVSMGYRDLKNGGTLQPFSPDTARAFTFQTGTWYTIHIEVRSSEMVLSIDNNRLFSASDDRIAKGGFDFEVGQGNQDMFDDLNIWALQ